jgi:hypothetical protein
MKNIIICSDGTWQSPESDTTTHVLRLAEGIAPQDNAGNKQVVLYDWGIGSEGDKFSGGITGQGLDKNIQDCYRFLVHNYEPGALGIPAPFLGSLGSDKYLFHDTEPSSIIKHTRQPEPLLHVSVKQRWQDDALKYQSPGLKALIERLGWDGIELEGSGRLHSSLG